MRRIELVKRMMKRLGVANVNPSKSQLAVVDMFLKRVAEPNLQLIGIVGSAGDQNLLDLVTVLGKQFMDGNSADAASSTSDENTFHVSFALSRVVMFGTSSKRKNSLARTSGQACRPGLRIGLELIRR